MAAGGHCPPELSGMFAFTEASAFCCRPDRVASVKISSHLSFDPSNGDIPLLVSRLLLALSAQRHWRACVGHTFRGAVAPEGVETAGNLLCLLQSRPRQPSAVRMLAADPAAGPGSLQPPA